MSPDRPEELAAAAQKQELGYALLSDRSMAASQAMGIAYAVDAATAKTYARYGIALATPPGAAGPQLPVPAVFLYRDGRMTFQYVNPDYQVRLDGDTLLAAARAAAK